MQNHSFILDVVCVNQFNQDVMSYLFALNGMFEYKTPKMDQSAILKSFANVSGRSFGFSKAI